MCRLCLRELTLANDLCPVMVIRQAVIIMELIHNNGGGDDLLCITNHAIVYYPL